MLSTPDELMPTWRERIAGPRPRRHTSVVRSYASRCALHVSHSHFDPRCVMELTEVRINLCGDRGGRLKAFCSLTFDNTFFIRDVKLIDGNDGLFLAMPSRKLCDHCPACNEKNHLRARYCNNCGRRLNEERHQQYRNGNGNGHS